MSKVEIKRLDSVTENDTAATLNINSNFEAVQKAIENTLSRNGTTPNFMDANLDMNSYRILNIGEAVDDTDAVSYKQFKEEIGEGVEAAESAAASAAQAASSAQSALVSSSTAIEAVRNSENILTETQDLFNDTKVYVDTAKAEIDETKNSAIASVNNAISELDSVVTAGKQSINSTVDTAKADVANTVSTAESTVQEYVYNAESEVRQIAVDEANKAIANAAKEATDIATVNINNLVDNTITPNLNSIVTNAESLMDSYALSASTSATNAARDAKNASADAENAAESAEHSLQISLDSEHYAEDSRIWAEGTDAEVQGLQGQHSSKIWSEMSKVYADSINPQQLVHKTGSETIGGDKTFTKHSYWVNDLADDAIVQKHNDYDRTETPTELKQRSFRILDKNSKIVGDFRTYAGTSGTVTSAMLARKSIDGVEKTAQVTARVGADGALSAYAPSARTSTPGAIITWNDMQIVSSLPENPVAGVFYYVPDDKFLPQEMVDYDYVVDYKTPTDSDPTWYRVYKSGWTEQGGILPTKSDWNAVTITFPKPFINTLYTVLTSTGHTSNTDANTITAKSTTNFTTTGYNSTGLAGWQASGQGV